MEVYRELNLSGSLELVPQLKHHHDAAVKMESDVDGTFLSNTELPSCNAEDFLDLSLDVDPGELVTYFQSGTCTIRNTRSDRFLEGKVLDQIPVSEEECLRIDVALPEVLGRNRAAVSYRAPLTREESEGWAYNACSEGRRGLL